MFFVLQWEVRLLPYFHFTTSRNMHLYALPQNYKNMSTFNHSHTPNPIGNSINTMFILIQCKKLHPLYFMVIENFHCWIKYNSHKFCALRIIIKQTDAICWHVKYILNGGDETSHSHTHKMVFSIQNEPRIYYIFRSVAAPFVFVCGANIRPVGISIWIHQLRCANWLYIIYDILSMIRSDKWNLMDVNLKAHAGRAKNIIIHAN